MKRIHFYVNGLKPKSRETKEVLKDEACRCGMCESDWPDVDVVVALGGDGTILRAVHEFPNVPVLGLNLGGLGFLSCVGKHSFKEAIGMLSSGEYVISERTMLQVRRADDDGEVMATALNDVVIEREMSGHAAVFDLEVNGCAATRYLADGLVFATPTGSTAYSLSAGGPVVLSDSGSFTVTPMNPHALGIRPMVVSDRSSFTVTPRARMESADEKVGVYADGEPVVMLSADCRVEIGKASACARIVELDGYDPYDVLARKLGWSGVSKMDGLTSNGSFGHGFRK